MSTAELFLGAVLLSQEDDFFSHPVSYREVCKGEGRTSTSIRPEEPIRRNLCPPLHGRQC